MRRPLTEEERRSASYNSLVQAQRQYAEKLTLPNGTDGRFTKEQYDSICEQLRLEDWTAGFVEDSGLDTTLKKENMGRMFSVKGKERAIELSDEEDAPNFRMEFHARN